MRFWEFIDGYYLLQGIDLYDLFNELPIDRTINILETLAVEEALRDGKANGAIEKVRTQIMSLNGAQVRKFGKDGEFEDDDIVETNPDEGWTVTDRDKVTGEFTEGLKVHNSGKFRLPPPVDGSSDSPFD